MNFGEMQAKPQQWVLYSHLVVKIGMWPFGSLLGFCHGHRIITQNLDNCPPRPSGIQDSQ